MMTKSPSLNVGLVYSETMLVETRHTVPHVGPWPGFKDMPDVFATAMMIGFAEQTCIQALKGHLPDGYGTVGVSVNIDHTAPTPVGGVVTANIELLAINKKRLSFAVDLSDDRGIIGSGTHDRMTINLKRFDDAVADRRE